MAYAQFLELGGASGSSRVDAASPTAAIAHVPADSLTELEWSVVAIARRDGRASLRPSGIWTKALRRLLKRPNPQLADLRLEALRRIAVLSWQHGYAVASDEVKAFLAAGFTAMQYETVVDSIGTAKSRRPTRSARRRPADASLAAVGID